MNKQFEGLVHKYYQGNMYGLWHKDGCFYGVEEIPVVLRGDWSDPSIIFEGIEFNYYTLEDVMWNYYREKCPDDGDGKHFDEWMSSHKYLILGEMINIYLFYDNEIITENGIEDFFDAIKRIPEEFVKCAGIDNKQNIYVKALCLYAESLDQKKEVSYD